MTSPSKTPQKIAMTGIKYVIEETKIAEERLSNLLKIIAAIEVPNTASKAIYPSALYPSG